MSNEGQAAFQGKDATTFEFDGAGPVWLRRLCGLPCGFGGRNEGPPRARGLTVLDTNIGRFEADGLTLAKKEFDGDSASFVWSAG
ncbi:MAG: hypothetical protein B1H02_00115, partial [Candidatus Latescibacteria bacterium 4484_107]